jgi:hypothetical protein
MNTENNNESTEAKHVLADVIPDKVISFMNNRKFYYDEKRMEYHTSKSIAKLLITFGNLVSKKTIEKCRNNIVTVDIGDLNNEVLVAKILEDFEFNLERDL